MIHTEPHTVVNYSNYIAERTRHFTGREWVFTAIDRWIADPVGSRKFLIVGAPGSGKSTVAARLVQMNSGVAPAVGLFGPGHLTFYHFCQASVDQTLTPLRFIAALAQTLAARYKPFQKAVRAAAERSSHITVHAMPTVNVEAAQNGAHISGVTIEVKIENVSARAAFDEALRKPLEALYTGDFNEQVLILVDSLDEARTWPGENILTLLGDVSDDVMDLPAPVRLLLTTRPDAWVLDKIGPPSLDLIEDAPDNIADVRTYAYNSLDELPEARRTDLARRVADEGNGNFLYARYLLENLKRDGTPTVDLSKLRLPKGLEGIYLKFLERLAKDDPEGWSAKYKPVIGILVVARERMSEGQLTNFSGQDQDQIRMVLEELEQFLEVDKRSLPKNQRTYTIYHRSFADFLLNPNLPGYLWCEPLRYHKHIVDYYLKTYENRWDKCDEYGLDHLLDHMFVLATQSNERDRQTSIQQLVALLLENGFLEAREKRLGLYPVQYDLQRAREEFPVDHRDRSRLLRAEQRLVKMAFDAFWSPPPDFEPDFKDAGASWAVWPRREANSDGVNLVTAKNGAIFLRQEAQVSASPEAVLESIQPTATSRLRFISNEPGRQLKWESGPFFYIRQRTEIAVSAIHKEKSLVVYQHMIWWSKPPPWLVRILPATKMVFSLVGSGIGPMMFFLFSSMGSFQEWYLNSLSSSLTNQLRQLNPSSTESRDIQRLEKVAAWYLSLVTLLIIVQAIGWYMIPFEVFYEPWLSGLLALIAGMVVSIAKRVSRWSERSATEFGRLRLIAQFARVIAAISIIFFVLSVAFFLVTLLIPLVDKFLP